MTFAAYGLERGCLEMLVVLEVLKEAARALNGWVVVLRVDDGALADDVVADDDGAGAREF